MLIFFIIISLSFAYNVGDIVNPSHQNQEFVLCHSIPGTIDNVISLGDYNGNTNGGDFNILVIDMSATWCGPCQALIPDFDQLYQNYDDNEHVEILVALSDLNQPYSCSQWGNMGTSGIPNIIDDPTYQLFNMFGSGAWPSLAIINHEMRLTYKEAGYSGTFVSDMSGIIDDMLFEMENSLILYNEMYFSIGEDDGDGILNPGESFNLDFIISNNSFDLDAFNVTAVLENNDDIVFTSNTLSFNDMIVGGTSASSVSGSVGEDVMLGIHNFELQITADYVDLTGELQQFTTIYPFSVDISLNQAGFPFDTNNEVKPSPLVLDFMGDGNNEIIFGDMFGYIHILNSDGSEVNNTLFPFDTGNQVWGSPAAGYIDQDENYDIVTTSKSKHLYILDQNELKLDFNANQFLIGTPSLGNLDDDNDLEIVFGSFSTNATLFAINIDGSAVDGFPVVMDEKMQRGVALGDFNGNGKDDIVLGTDDDNIYLIFDDGTIAPGFPYTTGDKVRSAPIILDYGDEMVILVGSNDDSFYAINSDGSLRFSFLSDNKIETSPSILETSTELLIFFGTNSGSIYAVDLQGNLIVNLNTENSSAIAGSIVFDDLNDDGLVEIICGDEYGLLSIFQSDNENYTSFSHYANFPASNDFAYSSSVNVVDIDLDGDLEIFGGTTGDVVVYDIKETSQGDDYWNVYRGNFHRNGFYEAESQCTAGDINGDSIINILDIVRLVNIVVDPLNEPTYDECAADLNSDGIINILDIVTLVNIVINESN